MAAPPIPPPPKNKSGKLSDGTYVIVSVEHKTVIDQVLEDLKYVQGYTPINNQKNQQWEVTAFGAGYVIRSKFDGAYLTVDSAIADNVAIVTSPYPVTWDLQAQDEENLIFQYADLIMSFALLFCFSTSCTEYDGPTPSLLMIWIRTRPRRGSV
ncbi:hypothetical protein ARMGADRAFT_490573 [Armillaria gallica]|uniref:Ricin B lectin domain-containing protein n=1 Tax=Armillaria gallica TaxID=47427 RepID=A0A2H3E5X0_ARMGA|nr:hypothetical protein ARMGADRAFT_490573 [Armillaria gallica]